MLRRPGVLAALVLVVVVFGLYRFRPHSLSLKPKPVNLPEPALHPIDDLIHTADQDFSNVLQRETFEVHTAAAAYRSRRDRHPPPKFDQWFDYAKASGAIVVEELFDQIYHDIEPFWGMPPQDIKDAVNGLEFVMSVRNGALDKDEDKRYRVNFWHEMVREIVEWLPDLDMGFNIKDEPRLLVPWEQMGVHMTEAQTKGRLRSDYNKAEEYAESFPSLRRRDKTLSYDHHWIGQDRYWNLVKETCPPGSGGREVQAIEDFAFPPELPPQWPFGSSEGYVANWTTAKDPCAHPHLRGLHGTFIEPVSLSTSKNLFPLFGGSKLPTNNEILIPAPRYWTTESKFSGESFWSYLGTTQSWNRKADGVMWRGVASGGRSRRESWTHYQRHRFISMLNSSHVASAEQGTFTPHHIPLPDMRRPYTVAAAEGQAEALPSWISSFADAAFTDLECFPKKTGRQCSYTDPYYEVAAEIPMYKMFDFKYLPDIDGNSFSGRYRAFLLSTSLPIKATVYSEWHDSRLWAWKHFVPMDNTFVDFYGIMEYFLGYDGGGGDKSRAKAGHDEAAKKIAMEGKEWAEKVLRKEDMLVYMYRLLLEYARVSSEGRERMAYVDDLK